MERAEFKRGDMVKFHISPTYSYSGDLIHDEMDIVGSVEIVDAFGTFEQNEEPSYDIYYKKNNMLYKHVRQSSILEYVGRAKEEEMLKW